MNMNSSRSYYKHPVQNIPEIKLLILYIAEQARSVCKQEQVSRLWLADFAMENIATGPNYYCYLTPEERIEDRNANVLKKAITKM